MESIVWLVLMVAFLLVEASTVVMVSLWFAAGSLVALIASLLGAQIWLQVVLFFVVSILLLGCLRPLVRKHFTPNLTRTNVDSLIGKKGYVTADIDNLTSTGQVKLGGMEWSARSAHGPVIQTGTLVKVERIEGNKVFVSPVEAKVSV